MKLTNIAFALPARDALALHDHLAANGVPCPGPRPNPKTDLSHIVAGQRGTDGDVQQARQIAKERRDSRGAAG